MGHPRRHHLKEAVARAVAERHVEHLRMLRVERHRFSQLVVVACRSGTRPQWRVLSGRDWASRRRQLMEPGRVARPTVPVRARTQLGVHNSSPYGANAALSKSFSSQ